jgi:glucokinase
MLPYKGKLQPWETFASGKAIFERYGKRAEDIHDEATWKAIVRDLSLGFVELIAVTQPDVIVIGGGVGSYFERFHKLLTDELRQYVTPLVKFPVFHQAKRPEQAVIYGCYDLARSTFAHKVAK